jgi:hypothetical protein
MYALFPKVVVVSMNTRPFALQGARASSKGKNGDQGIGWEEKKKGGPGCDVDLRVKGVTHALVVGARVEIAH